MENLKDIKGIFAKVLNGMGINFEKKEITISMDDFKLLIEQVDRMLTMMDELIFMLKQKQQEEADGE